MKIIGVGIQKPMYKADQGRSNEDCKFKDSFDPAARWENLEVEGDVERERK